jgi:hypothetical protein
MTSRRAARIRTGKIRQDAAAERLGCERASGPDVDRGG